MAHLKQKEEVFTFLQFKENMIFAYIATSDSISLDFRKAFDTSCIS